MSIQQDVTFAQQHLPIIKKAVKFVAYGVLAVTLWKGVHGFFPTAGVITGAVLFLIGDLL